MLGVDDECDHLFEVVQVNADKSGARLELECAKGCGAISYEASRSDRPALGIGDV